MEQLVGTPPFRFEPTGPNAARAIEYERRGLVGEWHRLERVRADGDRRWSRLLRPRWVTVECTETDSGTEVSVAASRGLGAVPRALQLVELLTLGADDRRTIYRERRIPPGPVTLVASWAGTPYPLYAEPRWSASRGQAIHTATRLRAVDSHGPFVKVRLEDGVEGWVERDQIVPAPEEATRDAQPRTAVLG